MVTNAVAFNMGGAVSSTMQRSESENGFSDVLDSVNKASSGASGTSKSGKNEEFAYTEVRGAKKAEAAENASPEMSEKAGEVLDNAASSLRKAFSELSERLTTETDEDAKNEIISALLEILKKFRTDNEDDEDMPEVMELLMAILVPADNSDAVSDVSGESDIAPVEAYTAVDEKSGEIELISSGTVPTENTDIVSEELVPEEAEAVPDMAEFVSETTEAAPETAETDMPVEAYEAESTAETVQTEKKEANPDSEVLEKPVDKLERLLDDILSKAKKDLGLTEAKLSSNEAVGEKVQSMPVSFNAKHSDRSGELSEILGKNTTEAAEVRNAETKTETVGAVHLAANLFENTAAASSRLTNEPVIPETGETAPPEVQTADEILARMENLRNGETEFTMVLNPESLGRITVKLVTAGERVAVQITAENPETGKLLEARTENLTSMLRDNGVELERCQVVSEGEDAQLMQDSYDGSSKNPYSRREEQQQSENDEEESFFDLLQSI